MYVEIGEGLYEVRDHIGGGGGHERPHRRRRGT